MFVFNCKPLRHKKLLLAVTAAVAVTALLCVVLAVKSGEKPPESAKSTTGVSYSAAIEKDDYAAFFKQLGIDADNAPLKRRTVTIPEEFNQTYDDYNALQKHAGLDLNRSRGREAEELTFAVHGGKAAYAVLLTEQSRVIGGHLTNGEYGSELLPLI